MAPLPWETRLTVMSSALAWSITARSTSGPSTLGISIRKCAPSGNRAAAGRGPTGSAAIPCRASTSAPVNRHYCTSRTRGRGGMPWLPARPASPGRW